MKELKYPFAVDKYTQEFRYAGDVSSGNACNCYCKLCNRNMVAINNINNTQRPHFRHEASSNCSASYESYIHWITKEIFKNISVLSLPDLSFLNLDKDFRRKLFQVFDNHNLPIPLRSRIKEHLIADINSKTKKFKVTSVDIEKEVATSTGKIRVDIILNFGNHKLFIEPYFSNPISFEKQKIIEEINISTISISLKEFLGKTSLNFSKEEFIDFLSNDLSSKTWIHHKINPTSSQKTLSKVEEMINDSSEALKTYKTKGKEMDEIEIEIGKLIEEKDCISKLILEKHLHKEAIRKYLDDMGFN
jgi:hypothetical protein